VKLRLLGYHLLRFKVPFLRYWLVGFELHVLDFDLSSGCVVIGFCSCCQPFGFVGLEMASDCVA
jgi:hypothetical protein